MTLPIACEEISGRFRDCVDRENLWGRILGRCDYLKDELELCLRKEYLGRKRRSAKNSKETRRKWEEANAEIGLDTPSK
ncbi:hypothetical protein HDU87_007095 [Geranomyces variabilis]|uniref:COX assembly mitochondrial protein n=1 Tax=Geranomyces variabilis TaxID=109894 RepID=A0AAD5XMY5_9FUNG|nr:hypothetical protein HDU87_007095 [Geranomyces variabilis]